MARPSDLTQEAINEAADQLKAEGKKPSPNAIRKIVNTGSFSTIKQMLDIWAKQQEQETNIPVPDMPDFAYRFLDKLHRELYMQNHQAVASERQALEVIKGEFENERSEMLGEINTLENRILELENSYAEAKTELSTMTTSLSDMKTELATSISKLNTQQIEIATLSEREKQLQAQLKEKDSLLEQATSREASLQETIGELSRNSKQ